MQFTININQEKLARSDLDLIDAAILEYLYHLCSSVSQEVEKSRKVDDSGVWTWVDLPTLAKEMPLLRIKNSTALSRRIPKIERTGFIVSKKGAGNKLYVKLTPQCDGLYRGVKSEMTSDISEMTTVTTSTRVVEPEMTKRRTRNDEYHRPPHTPFKENIINNSKQVIPPIVPPSKFSTLESITEDDLIEISATYKVPYAFVSLQFEVLTNYCESSGKKYKNYKSALKNFVLRDMKKHVERMQGDPTKRGIDARDL